MTFVSLAAAAVNLLAAAVGGWAWWRVEPTRLFWPLLRAGQGAAVVVAVIAGVRLLLGETPSSSLFWVYVLVPLVVAFVGEQLRLASAQTILDTRGLEDAQAMRTLGEREQRSVVLAIVRREIGVMALAAGAATFLLLRAAGTA